MKSLLETLNEALNGLHNNQYKTIWSGKFNGEISQEIITDPIEFFTELFKSYKNGLPTEKEWINVCEFIAKHMSSMDKSYIDVMTNIFIEVFFNMSPKSQYYDLVNYATFVGVVKLTRDVNKVGDKGWKGTADILDAIGKPYGLDASNWPNYYNGIRILQKTFR